VLVGVRLWKSQLMYLKAASFGLRKSRLQHTKFSICLVE